MITVSREETPAEDSRQRRGSARGCASIASTSRLRPSRGAACVTAGEWLLSRAADFGSDLIVIGGYGHTRMRELILGGVTRTMLQAMTVPVLMSH